MKEGFKYEQRQVAISLEVPVSCINVSCLTPKVCARDAFTADTKKEITLRFFTFLVALSG